MIIGIHIKIFRLSLFNQNCCIEVKIKLQTKTGEHVYFFCLHLSQVVSESKLLPDSNLGNLGWCGLFPDELVEFQYFLSLQTEKACLIYNS